MNAGKLQDSISLLYIKQEDNRYCWQVAARLWASTNEERSGRTGVVALAELSAPVVSFTVRTWGITPGHAILFNGHIHAVQSVVPHKDRGFMVVSAIRLQPADCCVVRTEATLEPGTNRPIVVETAVLSFPAFFLPKQLAFISGTPNDATAATYQLVTPKEVALQTGEAVTVDGVVYCVQTVFTADPYRNAYTVFAKKDA